MAEPTAGAEDHEDAEITLKTSELIDIVKRFADSTRDDLAAASLKVAKLAAAMALENYAQSLDKATIHSTSDLMRRGSEHALAVARDEALKAAASFRASAEG